MSKPTLLWVGDAVVPTGFERVTRNIVTNLKDRWNVHVLGLNYLGDPHEYPKDIKVYPASLGGDLYGIGRLEPLCQVIKPDVIVVLNDPWNLPHYLKELVKHPQFPMVGYMPVDAPNHFTKPLNGLARAVAYTNFGRQEIGLGGFAGRCDVAPHGVDTKMFFPADMAESRKRLRFKDGTDPNDLFIVGNINRNAPRKRLDLTIEYFAQFWYNVGQPKHCYLYLHCAARDQGWNVMQLARYYGIEQQLIITNPKMTMHNCMKEDEMRFVYSMFDFQMSTCGGEGWGLTTHEGMACGVPQLLPRYSALAEWCDGAAEFVECTSFAATPGGINTVAGFPDKAEMVAKMEMLYRNPERRRELGALGLARATSPSYSWPKIADQFHTLLLEVMIERQKLLQQTRAKAAPLSVVPKSEQEADDDGEV